MEKNMQLDKLYNSINSENPNSLVQLNVAITKSTKIKFMRFCIENEVSAKHIAELALLEFLERHE